jgi:transcriptional regulator with XRE-family HTH domain
MTFGRRLRELRRGRGLGLKRLAPELGITYGYLSKVETDRARPSEAFVERVARYFDSSSETLRIAADRIPEDVLVILRENPDEAIGFLRERFGERRTTREPSTDRRE